MMPPKMDAGVGLCTLFGCLRHCLGAHGVPWCFWMTLLVGKENADLKNGSRAMELDTVRYCAFADPGQMQKTRNLNIGAVGGMDIEEASEFFRNTSTNDSSSSHCRKPFP